MTESVRTIRETFGGTETLEGAGVRLRRMFGNQHVPRLDPFLLLDHFGSSDPADYVAGFPWHPHRGIETVTYMLDGKIAHGDSLGNEGVIRPGDVQWMSSGSGIIHQEMPQQREGRMDGFQLWVNLPARSKMETPAYRGLTASELPVVPLENGGKVRIIAGRYGGVDGPVREIPVDPTYLDTTLPARGTIEYRVPPGHTALAHVLEGAGQLTPDGPSTAAGTMVQYGPGELVRWTAGDAGLRALFVAGRPLGEPVAWYGPIVMNSNEELRQAMVELQRGDFIKERRPILEE